MSIGRPPGPIEPPPPPPLTVEPQSDGSLVLVSTEPEDPENPESPGPSAVAVPLPPATGIYSLTSVDGVLAWQEVPPKVDAPVAVKATTRKPKE